jgi:hypothetical protein
MHLHVQMPSLIWLVWGSEIEVGKGSEINIVSPATPYSTQRKREALSLLRHINSMHIGTHLP